MTDIEETVNHLREQTNELYHRTTMLMTLIKGITGIINKQQTTIEELKSSCNDFEKRSSN